MNQFVKQAYVQGLAARAILRARIMQKRAGIGDYALAGGVGAGGGAIIGALVNAARKKNMLHGALAGAGIGGVAGLGYQGIKDLMKGKPAEEARSFRANDSNLPDNPTSSITKERKNLSQTSIPLSDATKADRRTWKDQEKALGLNNDARYRSLVEFMQGQGSAAGDWDNDAAIQTFAVNSPEQAAGLIDRLTANMSRNESFGHGSDAWKLLNALKTGLNQTNWKPAVNSAGSAPAPYTGNGVSEDMLTYPGV